MASGSSSASSMLIFGTAGTTDNMEIMTNSQQDLTTMLSNSWFSAQQYHLAAPKQQDPEAQVVIEVTPTTLVDTNRFVCEVCYKGFAREQNLTLHRRTHNYTCSLKSDKPKDPVPRKVYLCPEPTCAHHNVSRALGDFGGLKKHYLRKHSTDRKYKCDTCSKAYSVETDLKAHLKVCGKKKYACVCGAQFTRNNAVVIHQEVCNVYRSKDAAKRSQKLHIGDNSISSTNTHPPTISDMRDKSDMMITSNETSNTLISPQISSMLTSSFNSYPSMVNFPSMGDINPPLFSQSSTQQINQFEFQENSDIGLYVDLLMDKIRLESFFSGNNKYYMGDGVDTYARYLGFTPAVHNTDTLNGMLNNGIQASTINQANAGASHETSYYGYGDGNGFGYGGGYDYGGGYGNGSGMEVFDFETSHAIAGAGVGAGTEAGAGAGTGAGAGAGAGGGAPTVQNLNQHGFWF